MQNYNPVVFNCILLYVLVVIISILQSRFKIITDHPLLFSILVVVVPLILFAKAAKLKTWTSITGFEIWGWTLILAYLNPKRIVPRINEGYIYAYTLFHWYLLIDTMLLKGINFWTGLVSAISIYPTFLVLKASLEHKKLAYYDKLVLYYWFLFSISFTYVDQVALDIITPILALGEVNFATTTYVLITAIQLYFISTSFSLLFVGVPIFHLDRSSEEWSVRWARAKNDWREVVQHKLGNYVEYQISLSQFLFVTFTSLILFYIDRRFDFRLYLIFFYTVIFPLIFFYFKYTPNSNLEEQ